MVKWRFRWILHGRAVRALWGVAVALLEADLQAAIMRWAETMEPRYPELKWLFHVPNGGRRNGREAVSLKAQGVKSGVLDLCLPVARGGYHGFWLELKKPNSNERPSDSQAEFMNFVAGQGYYAAWTNDFEKAKGLIVNYLDSEYDLL